MRRARYMTWLMAAVLMSASAADCWQSADTAGNALPVVLTDSTGRISSISQPGT